MPDDLYSLWLKVPPGPRPPDHYALLGLPRFCDNQEQIEAAAQKQLDELDRHSLHNDIPRREACHRMMNEVARAKVALTNPQKRAAYDQILEPGRIPPPPPPVPRVVAAIAPPPSSPEHTPETVVETVESQEKPADLGTRLIAAAQENPVLWIVPAACIAIIVGAIVVVRLARPTPPPAIAGTIPRESKRGPATGPSSIPAVHARPPAASQTNPAPTVAPTTSVAAQNSEIPTTAPTPAIGKTKPPEPEPPVVKRKPIPAPDARRASMKLCDDIYGEKTAAAKTPAEKAAVARAMFGAVAEMGNHDSDRFILLTQCADLAVAGRDIDTALSAIDRLAGEFEIDGLRYKARALAEVGVNATEVIDRRPLIRQTAQIIEQAIRADRYEIAREVAESNQVAAKAANDSAWLNSADAETMEAKLAESWSRQAAFAVGVLAKHPENVISNTEMGLFRCLMKGDWESGLPMVAAGIDKGCQALAVTELTHPVDPEKIIEVADGWWDTRERMPKFTWRELTLHARSLYSAVLPKASGAILSRARKRIDEANAFLAAQSP